MSVLMLPLPSHHTMSFFHDLAKRTRWISALLNHINNEEVIGSYHLSKWLCLNREYDFLSATNDTWIAVPANTIPSHVVDAMWAVAHHKIFQQRNFMKHS